MENQHSSQRQEFAPSMAIFAPGRVFSARAAARARACRANSE